MRRPHFLTHNKGAEYPREICIVDTETREELQPDGARGHLLEFGWAYYARRRRGDAWIAEEWLRFDSRRQFWKWLLGKLRKKSRLTIFAHNVPFDGPVLDAFGELRRRGYRITQACLEGPPTIIAWRRGSRSLRWIDTLNIWKVPLESIGRKVGLRKLKRPRRWGNKARDDRYGRRDVEILRRALLEWWAFLRAHDLGTFAPTLAAQAFSSYRHRFMSAPIFIDCNAAALELARRAYLGGRNECFRLGLIDEPGGTLDVNSMYPHVMRSLEAPARLLTYRTAATLADLERYARDYAVVADVTLSTDEPAYPYPIDGRLCFPIGEFRQALNTPELRYALERGHVRAVHAVAVYAKAVLFSSWVEWVYGARLAARRRGDELDDWNLRLLGNSLYGKWGQRGRVWEMAGDAADCKVQALSSFDVDTGEWRVLRQLGRQYQELRDVGESLNSSPAISGHITSAGRLMLWRLILEAGREEVWYCDTDSLKGSRRMLERLRARINPDALGALKLEERHRWCQVNGCKDYLTPGSRKRKGVRAAAESNDGVAFLQDQWLGWAGLIRRGRLDMPVTIDQVKSLTGSYQKGRVLENGRVAPLRLRLAAFPAWQG